MVDIPCHHDDIHDRTVGIKDYADDADFLIGLGI